VRPDEYNFLMGHEILRLITNIPFAHSEHLRSAAPQRRSRSVAKSGRWRLS
jgi:hypothetical protein